MKAMEEVAIKMTPHAARRIKTRLGSGTSPTMVAQRAFNRKQEPPAHWKFPPQPQSTFYAYGDILFVFRKGSGTYDYRDVYCATVLGPFRPDGSWWEDRDYYKGEGGYGRS